MRQTFQSAYTTLLFLGAVSFFQVNGLNVQVDEPQIVLRANPLGAGQPVPESFISFSIEFSLFPDYAGNLSSPNNFSNNLLDSIARYQGTKPHIRVGGTSQDYALYNASLREPIRPVDATTFHFGKTFFESYLTWPDVKFIHGFNLRNTSPKAHSILLETVPILCKTLSNGRLLYWEAGNEPDLYRFASPESTGTQGWTGTQYVNAWQNLTRTIRTAMASVCPDLADNDAPRYIAPSMSGTGHLYHDIWAAGLNDNSSIAQISSHNYIAGARQPGVTLQGTLLNHTQTTRSVDAQVAEKQALAKYDHPFILGETNSLHNGGKLGVSNTFGAALWAVDFGLYCASQNISRLFFHQGTDLRYSAWQPVTTNYSVEETKPPFYGSIAVAAMMGNLVKSEVRIRHIPLDNEKDAAYVAYENGTLVRAMLINMRYWNDTAAANVARPSKTYSLSVPQSCKEEMTVEYLQANGSDSQHGITWAGLSFDRKLKNGQPVPVANVTVTQKLIANGGVVVVTIPDSGAGLVSLTC